MVLVFDPDPELEYEEFDNIDVASRVRVLADHYECKVDGEWVRVDKLSPQGVIVAAFVAKARLIAKKKKAKK